MTVVAVFSFFSLLLLLELFVFTIFIFLPKDIYLSAIPLDFSGLAGIRDSFIRTVSGSREAVYLDSLKGTRNANRNSSSKQLYFSAYTCISYFPLNSYNSCFFVIYSFILFVLSQNRTARFGVLNHLMML